MVTFKNKLKVELAFLKHLVAFYLFIQILDDTTREVGSHTVLNSMWNVWVSLSDCQIVSRPNDVANNFNNFINSRVDSFRSHMQLHDVRREGKRGGEERFRSKQMSICIKHINTHGIYP